MPLYPASHTSHPAWSSMSFLHPPLLTINLLLFISLPPTLYILLLLFFLFLFFISSPSCSSSSLSSVTRYSSRPRQPNCSGHITIQCESGHNRLPPSLRRPPHTPGGPPRYARVVPVATHTWPWPVRTSRPSPVAAVGRETPSGSTVITHPNTCHDTTAASSYLPPSLPASQVTR